MVRRYLWALGSRAAGAVVSLDTDWEPGDVTSSGFPVPYGSPISRQLAKRNPGGELQFLKILKYKLLSLPLTPFVYIIKWAQFFSKQYEIQFYVNARSSVKPKSQLFARFFKMVFVLVFLQEWE